VSGTIAVDTALLSALILPVSRPRFRSPNRAQPSRAEQRLAPPITPLSGSSLNVRQLAAQDAAEPGQARFRAKSSILDTFVFLRKTLKGDRETRGLFQFAFMSSARSKYEVTRKRKTSRLQKGLVQIHYTAKKYTKMRQTYLSGDSMMTGKNPETNRNKLLSESVHK